MPRSLLPRAPAFADLWRYRWHGRVLEGPLQHKSGTRHRYGLQTESRGGISVTGPVLLRRACHCGAVVPVGDRCLRCTPQRYRQQDKRRGNAAARGYNSAWRKLRSSILREEPLCRRCAELGRTTAANEVHHIQTIATRPDLRLDKANLMALCKACHSAITMRESVCAMPNR